VSLAVRGHITCCGGPCVWHPVLSGWCCVVWSPILFKALVFLVWCSSACFQVWSLTSTSLWLGRRASRRPYNLEGSGRGAPQEEVPASGLNVFRLEHLSRYVWLSFSFTRLGYFFEMASKKLIFCVVCFYFAFFFLQFLFWLFVVAFVAFICLNGVLIKLLLGICSLHSCIVLALCHFSCLRSGWCSCTLVVWIYLNHQVKHLHSRLHRASFNY